MVQLGKYNRLTVVKEVDFGIYLDGGEDLEILMPCKYVPEGTKVGDELRCFVYQDSEARLIATTERPYATVGEFASLKINSVNAVGAFADWGTSKELLIPHREQNVKMEEGHRYIVYIYIDTVSGRIVGTAKVDKYLDNVPPQYQENEEVDALVWKPTPLGYKVIINNKHTGLIYKNQIFQPVHVGEHLRAWVKGIREDDKIDLMLQPMGYRNVIDSVEAMILKGLHNNDGFLPLTDKTDPEVIADKLQCSKKNFKKAVGALYKKGRIKIEDEGIRLL
ncbi:MAG: S1-like domain-containing RNA-binding protein [Bacteroidales bacterium]|nr:S1-like domain-containing RNA-binding protein [Bacteroidales bacterium]